MTIAVPRLIEYLLGPGATWREVGLAALDLAVVGYAIHRVLLLLRGTRAIHVLLGLFLLGVGYLGSQWAHLVTLNWLLGNFLTYTFLFGVIVLFQADIRRGLAHLGRSRLLAALAADAREQAGVIDAVARAAVELSARRRGALVVIERLADLDEVIETGVELDAVASPDLLLALFHPGGALHDGAVVLQRGRVAAASCLLPLAATPQLRELGTRHRAALGLAEELDAAVVVISEERGEISLAVDGELKRGLHEGELRRLLAALLVPARPTRAEVLLRLLGRRPPTRQRPARRKPAEDDRAAV